VEIFQFDRRERIIRSHSSRGLAATRIAAGEGKIHLTCLTVEPGGVIGTHPATSAQLFLVIAGEGWIAGTDGRHIPIRTGWGVRWNAGEEHTSGTETGFIALAVEGAPLGLFEPEMPVG
jgi:mannose-6-phosphate isomerase-like protein (cupin superfamily)